uniref:Uncharacterized protein n=1 Tax=Rhizophora mucronata TaxID=61149 RepID=A0A2P2N9P9_RHIMU
MLNAGYCGSGRSYIELDQIFEPTTKWH